MGSREVGGVGSGKSYQQMAAVVPFTGPKGYPWGMLRALKGLLITRSSPGFGILFEEEAHSGFLLVWSNRDLELV